VCVWYVEKVFDLKVVVVVAVVVSFSRFSVEIRARKSSLKLLQILMTGNQSYFFLGRKSSLFGLALVFRNFSHEAAESLESTAAAVAQEFQEVK